MNNRYSLNIVLANQEADQTRLGVKLGKKCIKLGVSVANIAVYLGVSRQTVYNWFEGGDIFPAYEHRVDTLLTILKAAHSADDAWRKICQHYGLVP